MDERLKKILSEYSSENILNRDTKHVRFPSWKLIEVDSAFRMKKGSIVGLSGWSKISVFDEYRLERFYVRNIVILFDGIDVGVMSWCTVSPINDVGSVYVVEAWDLKPYGELSVMQLAAIKTQEARLKKLIV